MKSMTIAMTLLAAFLAAPSLSQAQQHDIEHLVVEMANTAQEHQGVAEHYRMRAQEAREEAASHQEMGRIYTRRRSSTPQLAQHCENLARKYNEIAADYDALAKEHDEISKNPAQ
jgi:hypothetical protein